MILVDTSIWIEFFKKKEPIFAVLKNLLENSEVFVPEIVFGELLQGCKSKYEEGILLEYWQNLNKLPNDESL
jgi:predicted nucleic acid-binding protein